MLMERFWSKVDKRGECWEWTASKFKDGYGAFSVSGKILPAHRFAYTLTKGPIPDGLFVLHSCDNRACVNPAHLRVGTDADNKQDVVERKRLAGVRNGYAKLSEAEVVEIRNSYSAGERQQAIATRYGITQACVSYIINRKIWSHV
jgi:hypothetical protein